MIKLKLIFWSILNFCSFRIIIYIPFEFIICVDKDCDERSVMATLRKNKTHHISHLFTFNPDFFLSLFFFSCSPSSFRAKMPIDLYYMPLSTPCRAVMLTAKAIGVDLNLKPIDVAAGEHMKPEFVALNPQHCIPTLVDGDLKLWERCVCEMVSGSWVWFLGLVSVSDRCVWFLCIWSDDSY